MLIIASCVSEEEPVEIPISDAKQAVADAKAWFGPKEEFVVNVKSGKNARVRDQIKKIHWNKAMVHEEGRVIEVEITYNVFSVPIRSAKTINDIKRKQKDAFFRLILERREDGGFDKFILKYFPEGSSPNQKKLQVNNYTIWSKDFSGDIQMISWDEQVNTGWYVENGEKVYTYFPKNESGKKSRSNANASLNCTPILEEVCFSYGDDEGEITCGGGYCDIPEFGIECFDIIAYEDPNCSDQYNPGSGPGTYTGPVGGGGSGSGTGGGGPTLQPLLEDLLYDKPFALLDSDIPCSLIMQWLEIAKFTPGQGIIDKLNTYTASYPDHGDYTVSDVANIQQIDNGYSKVVNMDYFAVTVSYVENQGFC